NYRTTGEQKSSESTNSKNYIIVTHDEYIDAAKKLALWKEQMGYSTDIVSASSWTASMVKDSIHTRYHNWSPKPDYFVIIGDHTGAFAVPGEVLNTPGPNFSSDLYYACMDGAGDYVADMAHGRISVSSAYEAMVVVDKVINYEKTPITDTSFYQDGLNCAQFQDDNKDGYADRRFTHTSENIRDYLISNHGYNVERIYYSNSDPKNYNNGNYSNGEPIPAELLKANGFNWNGGETEITAAINAGKFYVFHRDHGYSGGSGWAHPYYTTSTMTSLSNGDKLPVIFSINCHTGEFQLDNCFAEKLVRMENKGAVGVVAASYYSYSGYNDGLACGMVDAIWSSPGLTPLFGSGGVPSPPPSTANNIRTMGDVVNQGLIRMMETWAGSQNNFKYQNELFHYFGDPAMKIWTEYPNLISANIPDSLNCGDYSINIKGASCDGMATAIYLGKLIGKVQLSGGSGTIHFDEPMFMPDSAVTITITSTNCRPLIKEVPVRNNCTLAPIAKITSSTSKACITDTVKLIDASYLGPDSWIWNIYPANYSFVNGTNKNDKNPEIVFDKEGYYEVSLIVSNTYGYDTVVVDSMIVINNLITNFSASVTTCLPGDEIQLTDLTQCYPDSWHWDVFPDKGVHFINGTSNTSQDPVLRFDSLGVFDVSLTTYNPYGADSIIKVGYINVVEFYRMCKDSSSSNLKGKIYDSGGPDENYSDYESCAFTIDIPCTDTIVLEIDTLSLSSGDYLRINDGVKTIASLSGNYASYPVVSTTGKMILSFTSNSSGNESGFCANWYIPEKGIPTADFIFSDNNPPFNSPVELIDSSSDGVIQRSWNFGNGEVKNSKDVTYQFRKSGKNYIELMVSNCYGADSIVKSLDVQLPPVANTTPDTIFSDLFTGEIDTVYVTIDNQYGYGDLVYEFAPGSGLVINEFNVGSNDWMELHNTTGGSINLKNWLVSITDGGRLDTFLLPNFVLKPKGYVALIENSGINTDTSIFLGRNIAWVSNSSGSISLLNPDGEGIDFVRFGSSTQKPPVGTNWTQSVPLIVDDEVMSAGRDSNSKDTDDSSDWMMRVATPGKVNLDVFESLSSNNQTYDPDRDVIRTAGVTDFELPVQKDVKIMLNAEMDTLAVGQSAVVPFIIDATGTFGGLYEEQLTVFTNDTAKEEIIIPVFVSVTGAPAIAVSDDTVDFGNVFINDTSIRSIIITNTGTDTLVIDSIYVDNKVFSLGEINNKLAVKDTVLLNINYTSSIVSQDWATIWIFSNSKSNHVKKVILKATSLEPPVISVIPDSLFADLMGSDSLVKTLTISNTGNSDLYWNLNIENVIQETDLYKKYKQNTGFAEFNDENNNGQAKVGPISIEKIYE
ncbi:MAG: C25 family cysteine peptidase, partial [Bacteroidales bacterium]|nr:C25 family cysteine peptidase [Bacteroidales bacterium]